MVEESAVAVVSVEEQELELVTESAQVQALAQVLVQALVQVLDSDLGLDSELGSESVVVEESAVAVVVELVLERRISILLL